LDELERVHRRFTEGFDTPDLAEAAALLRAGREAAVASNDA
jgi:hypothetical protein